MLETIRHYARDRLAASGEAAVVRDRHLAHFADVAEEVEPDLYGPRTEQAFARLDAEHANMAAALSWSEESGRAGDGLRIVGALGRYWCPRGMCSEGGRWAAGLLALRAGAVRA